MRFLIHNRRHLLTALHDTFMAGASFLLALYLRLNEGPWPFDHIALLNACSLCMLSCLVIFTRMRLYRGLWRYASIPDLVAITRAASLALLLFYLILFLTTRLENMPRSVPFIHWLLLLALLGAPRFLYRFWRDRQLGLNLDLHTARRVPVLLIGAGRAAELFLRDTKSGASRDYFVAGILDDDPSQMGHTMHNVRIYGTVDALPEIAEKLARQGIEVQRVILTDDSIDGTKTRTLFEDAYRLGMTLARLPRLSEFHAEQEKPVLQPIAVEDLLGRKQNVQDVAGVEAFIKGKVVVVTGVGGTIGSELARQIAGFKPSKLVLFESSEYALYQIDLEFSRLFPEIAREAVLGDVRNLTQLIALFNRIRPQLIFHAAAIKHVPLAESNPVEAMLTNIFGTIALADACIAAQVEGMVLISTDKAVNPTNVMGAAKRCAESYCQALGASQNTTRFTAVRFGNVLGSTGSVVPLFQQQLARGGPLTITHPDIERYFMTVREAVELVLQAAVLPREDAQKSGEVYVLDMGQPVKILDLALQMIRLAGRVPYRDIPIAFTGLRPGEKMYEELFHDAENSAKTAHASIWLANPRFTPLDQLRAFFSELHQACAAREEAQAKSLLQRLVPEYQPTVHP